MESSFDDYGNYDGVGVDDGRCPRVPPGLHGRSLGVDVRPGRAPALSTLTGAHPDLLPGGQWRPSRCLARHTVAIVVPYRDRWDHLKLLLHYLLPILKRQQIHFRIFVVEQHGKGSFNKGRIMNAAFLEAAKVFDFRCVIFHDVDMVSVDDRNMYTCADNPKHMSCAIDKFHYVLFYENLVGGVLAFRKDHFKLVNGYSNAYWGWGGEDDEMAERIKDKGLKIHRAPCDIARYKMVKHRRRKRGSDYLQHYPFATRSPQVEGLNNVPYKVFFQRNEALFTHIMVDVGQENDPSETRLP